MDVGAENYISNSGHSEPCGSAGLPHVHSSSREGTGLVHVYCGDGKGKTTCGMGLCCRAAGFGYKILIYQFMKPNTTSERKVLGALENVTFIDGKTYEKFSFNMTEEEKAERRLYYSMQLRGIAEKAYIEEYDVLFLDEVLYTIDAGLLVENELLDVIDNRRDTLEVILTGRNPSQTIIDRADYVSEIRKIKHPFDRGQMARKGIER